MRLTGQDRGTVLVMIVLAVGLTGALLMGQSASMAVWAVCLGDQSRTLSVVSVTACLAAGADPMARAADGTTPLHAAAGRRGSLAAVEALLAAGSDPNARDLRGTTPLHNAVFSGRDKVDALLAAGADPNAQGGGFGGTPLHSSMWDAGVVEALLAAGADPNARNGIDETPLHQATAETVGALLAAGADPNARNDLGRTPLHQATVTGTVEALLLAGAHVMARDADGKTPLHHAADLCGGSCPQFLAFSRLAGSDDDDGNLRRRIGHDLGALRALLAAGGDPNAGDGLGWTPLHLVAMASTGALSSSPALRFGTTEAVRTLLAAGADANARNGDGETPFDLAERGSDAYWLLNDARFNAPRQER